jgi:hypothetical protein
MRAESAALFQLGEALTRVFTWSCRTSSWWSEQQSLSHTFTEGVSGYCLNRERRNKDLTQFMGFLLEEGPACTMHFKCMILDKDDKVLRVRGMMTTRSLRSKLVLQGARREFCSP